MKDDSSNDVDWVRDQRFILIDAQKYYVLDAPLGDKPPPANVGDLKVWQTRSDDYSIV